MIAELFTFTIYFLVHMHISTSSSICTSDNISYRFHVDLDLMYYSGTNDCRVMFCTTYSPPGNKCYSQNHALIGLTYVMYCLN